MRLTLRTLLAHLDNQLDVDDNAAIAAKLRESEFASSLAKRIMSCIANERIGSASPIASSTADDANRIGEYLDSVLPPEQVAEIERICLESESHLAEVAACHQILAIVLGNPAEVPSALRSRIYDLGQHHGEMNASDVSANGNMAGTVHRVASSTGATTGDDALTRAMTASQAPPTNPIGRSRAIHPVGPDDSGVSDAPTRLREIANSQSAAERRKSVGSGARKLDAAEASALFGRPSRVVPWLVSLALAASFLFVAVQAFSPLLKKKSPTDDALALATADPSSATSDAQVAEIEDHIAVSPADVISETVLETEASEAPPMVELDPSIQPANGENATAAMTNELQPNATAAETTEMLELPIPVAEPIASLEQADSAALPDLSTNMDDAPPPPIEAVVPTNENPTLTETTPPSSDVAAVGVPAGATTITSEGTLILLRKPSTESFVLAKKGDQVPLNSDIICPPLYRDRVSLFDTVDLTLIGPAKMRIDATNQTPPTLTIASGRFLLTLLADGDAKQTEGASADEPATKKNMPIRIVFDGVSHELSFAEPDAVAAIEIIPFRNPGTDPEDERSTTKFIEVLSVQGTLGWQTEGTPSVSISTGEIARWSSAIAISKSASTSIPTWIDSPKPAAGSIETSARDGLLALVRENESIELSLREAIDFRRAEVGALAAQTLVLLDRPDVYFGADGILGDVKQKAFWPDHFSALVNAIDRGPESAAMVRGAINQMDSAEAPAIFRLLWLYSNAQLEAGGDERLVASLDSPNMTVRVLTAENLRRITGTTLFYKPENDTAPRRSSDIKKWETRLRKGDIRWAAAGQAEAK